MHLDGARIFNAATALAIDPHEITQYFDSVTLCLSKGLGCPIGGILAGKKDFIQKAKAFKKMLGGIMAQGGMAAAAGVYSLSTWR